MKNSHFSLKTTIILGSLFLLYSCGEVYNPNKAVIYLSASNEEWLLTENQKNAFRMISESGDYEQFELDEEMESFDILVYFSKEGEGTNVDLERKSQEFISDLGTEFSIKLEAVEASDGTRLITKLNEVEYRYDLKYNELFFVNTNFGYLRAQLTNEESLESKAIYHDTLNINDKEYFGVLEFRLNDFADEWEDSTVVEFTIAKELGLIRYTLNNGVVMVRE